MRQSRVVTLTISFLDTRVTEPLAMSRLTAAQVISLGQYLEPDFNPSSLTVSQLLGVLGYHNIPYPMPYSKPKLVQVFNDEVKSRASKFKKERLKRQNSMASDDGITDGVTGRLLNGGRKVPALPSIHSVRDAHIVSRSNSPRQSQHSRRHAECPAASRKRPSRLRTVHRRWYGSRCRLPTSLDIHLFPIFSPSGGGLLPSRRSRVLVVARRRPWCRRW